MAVIPYLVFEIAVVSECQVLRYVPFFVAVCVSTLLSQYVIFLHLAPIESNKMFGYVLWQLDQTVCWCVAVPSHHLHNAVPSPTWRPMWSTAYFRNESGNSCAVGCPLPVSTSSPHLSTGSFWRVYVFSLCNFCRWHQCISFNWIFISDSRFSNRYSRRRYCNYFQWSFLGGIRFMYDSVARLSVCSRGNHCWVVEVDVRCYGKWPWRFANFSIGLVSISLLWRLNSYFCVSSHCGTAVW